MSSVPNLHKIIMRRFSIILLLILYSSLSALAQQTYFYRLNGVVTNGIKKAPGFSSGIFVTFSKDICYDSDRDGFYANNGKLTKIVEGTDADQYRGNCYFGNAEYIVSKSRDLINVRCADGIIYVYYRESPLASDTRSTYGNIPRKLSESAPAVPIQQPSDNSFNTPQVIIIEKPSEDKSSRSSHDITCPVCHGTGKCSTCAGRGWKKHDGYSGSVYDCIICHGTGRCTSCYGRGTIRN